MLTQAVLKGNFLVIDISACVACIVAVAGLVTQRQSQGVLGVASGKAYSHVMYVFLCSCVLHLHFFLFHNEKK